MSHQSKLHLFPIGVRLIYKSTYIINYSTVLSKEKSNVWMTATTLFDKIQHPHFTNNNKYLSKLGNMKLCSCCSIKNLIKRIKTGQQETSSSFPGQWRMQLAQYSLLISSHIIPEASWDGTLHRHQYRPHLDSDMDLGNSLDPETSWLWVEEPPFRWEWFWQPCGRRTPSRPQDRPPATVGPRTPKWSLAATGSGCHHCPQQQSGPKTPIWPLILSVFVVFDGSKGIGHQLRPWLQ